MLYETSSSSGFCRKSNLQEATATIKIYESGINLNKKSYFLFYVNSNFLKYIYASTTLQYSALGGG